MADSSQTQTQTPEKAATTEPKTVSSADRNKFRSERAEKNKRRFQRGGGASGMVQNKYRNVHIAQKDQAIWDYFRARTQPKTSIYIGKNTIIGPGVQIFADKGTIRIGDNNIIGEGTIIINKSSDELIIGNGNVFECNCRIEGSRINDYNVFGAKCHVMSGAMVGTGCVICPRVMVIAKKRLRDCIVVFGDNMVHEQPLMKKRNRAYIEQMVLKLRHTFQEVKMAGPSGRGGRRGGHHGSRHHGSRPPNAIKNPQSQMTPDQIAMTKNNRSRQEKPISPPKP